MTKNDDLDFDKLFKDNIESNVEEEAFTFDEIDDIDSLTEAEQITPENISVPVDQKKRCSDDFEPDMDALLITAQAPLIIEGTKYLSLNDCTAKRLPIYLEAIRGVDLYIKIIDRDPNSFWKLKKIREEDIDCKEFEKITKNTYLAIYGDVPETDSQYRKSFEVIRDKLFASYRKALINNSMSVIRKYFLLSGGLDKEKVRDCIQSENEELNTTVQKIEKHIHIAIDLINPDKKNIETTGIQRKNMSIFIIKSSELLWYYFRMTNREHESVMFKRINTQYKKYFIV